MTAARNVLDLGWDEVHRDSEALARLPQLQRPWTGILAAARGGLIPAALLGHALDVRRIEVVSVVTYDDRRAQAPRVLGQPDLPAEGAGWLLVDDLVDSGVTARTIRALFPAVTIAVLYAKPAGEALADAFVRRVPQDTWLVFPWERTLRAATAPSPSAPAEPTGPAVSGLLPQAPVAAAPAQAGRTPASPADGSPTHGATCE
ncbi:MAG: xanthine phosphoribosyltransferase [Rhodospirillales bacterium]|nr:xanthine phosphoribosyltransferase [Rhodospirillales bacterium]